MAKNPLMIAIEKRKRHAHALQRKRIGPGKRETEVMDTLRANPEAAKAWEQLTTKRSRWSREIDHDEVLDLLLKSVDIADRREASRYSRKAIEKRFRNLKAACSVLLTHYMAEAGVYDHEIDPDAPLDGSKGWPYKWAYYLWGMMDDLVVEECLSLGLYSVAPERPTSHGVDGSARLFEHAFSTLLHRSFGRPFDRFVLDLSEMIFPEARALNDVRTLQDFRQRERERISAIIAKS